MPRRRGSAATAGSRPARRAAYVVLSVALLATTALVAPAAASGFSLTLRHPFPGDPWDYATWSLGGCRSRLAQPIAPAFHNLSGVAAAELRLSMGPCQTASPTNATASLAAVVGEQSIEFAPPSSGRYRVLVTWSISADLNLTVTNGTAPGPARGTVSIDAESYLQAGVSLGQGADNAWSYALNSSGGSVNGTLRSVTVVLYTNATLVQGQLCDLTTYLELSTFESVPSNGHGSISIATDLAAGSLRTRLVSVQVR